MSGPRGGALSGHRLVIIVDFGSQYTQLIARRVREAAVYCEIVPPSVSPADIKARSPLGIILSGGPASVREAGAPQADPGLLDLGIPVLGICYGQQWMAAALGGHVAPGAVREYGRAVVDTRSDSLLLAGLGETAVWMSHGDKVDTPPQGFTVDAWTDAAPHAAMSDEGRKLFGLQFHPEVTHTPEGRTILHRFLYDVCGATGDWTPAHFVSEAVERIRAQVGEAGVVLGLSGGVDSAVAAALVAKAIGRRLHCVFVDTGLLRLNEGDEVERAFAGRFDVDLVRIDAAGEFFEALRGVEDPEAKRKIIGRLFVEVFEREAKHIPGVEFLGQGTIYPDVIESARAGWGHSVVIKSHHNVGGLPERMGLKLLEPLRELFKDEVRQAGRELGLPEHLVARHPFPGPGLAVRILGEVTPDRAKLLARADAIFIDELRASGWYERTAQAFAVLLPVRSVGVMGDGRTYENVAALRAVTTQDFMTADWAPLPHELLARVSNRIINEVRGINRVVYDVSSKPPATIEWE